jgi:acyl carrier protein
VEKLPLIIDELLGETYSTAAAVDHFRKLEQWDSLQYLKLVLTLQQEFGVEFSPVEIEQLTSVVGIEAVLKGKGVQL